MYTIVILHGWGHSKASWQAAFEGMSDIRMIAYDLPGFGSEPFPPAGGPDWGVPEYAAWVQEKIETEGLQQVMLLGHSFGGRIAAHVASGRPTWLSALILYAAPCLYRPSLEVRFKKNMARVAKMFGLKGKYRGNPELVEADQHGLGGIYRRVVNFDQTSILKEITVPTLLLWGEKDMDVPLRIAHEMSELIPASQLEILPGLGHNAHIENPNLFYGVVKKYIQTL